MHAAEVTDQILSYLWLLPTAIAGYGVKYLHSMSKSVETLNLNIAVMVTRVDDHRETLEDHELRLRAGKL